MTAPSEAWTEETLARHLCRLHFDRREWRGACTKAERTAWLVEKYWPQWRSDAASVIAKQEGAG